MARVAVDCPDLLFGSKLQGALRAAGHEVVQPGEEAELLIVDLPADPVARAGPGAARAVTRVRELAAVERQAAAADALGQAELEALELGDALVDARAPAARQ